MVVPTAAVVVAFVDFLISLGILVALMVWYDFYRDGTAECLPLFVLLGLGLSRAWARPMDYGD